MVIMLIYNGLKRQIPKLYRLLQTECWEQQNKKMLIFENSFLYFLLPPKLYTCVCVVRVCCFYCEIFFNFILGSNYVTARDTALSRCGDLMSNFVFFVRLISGAEALAAIVGGRSCMQR